MNRYCKKCRIRLGPYETNWDMCIDCMYPKVILNYPSKETLKDELIMNSYESPNQIREKYKRPQVDWGLAFLLFFGFYGFFGFLIWLSV